MDLNALPTIDQVINASVTNSQAPQQGDHGLVVSGLGSGIYGGLSELGNAARAVGTAVGATGFAQSAADFAARQQATAQTYARPDLEALPWYSPTGLAYRTLQGLPQFATMVGGGALGAAALPEELAGAGAAALAARFAGAGAAAYPFQVGANVERADQEGQPVDAAGAGKALALGVPEAALQGILPGLGEGFLAGKLAPLAGRGLLRQFGVGAGIGVATQAPVQAATEALMQKMGDPNRSFAERSQEVLNAALMGATQGAVFGGFTHMLAKEPAPKVTNENLGVAIDSSLNLLPAPGTPGTEPGLPPPQRFQQPPEPLPGVQPVSGETITPPVQPGQTHQALPLPSEAPKLLPEPALEGARPVAGEALTTPVQPGQAPEIGPDETTTAYKDRLAQFDNATLLNHAQMQGPDSLSGQAALEVLADRLKGRKPDDVHGALAQQDAERQQQALVDQHRQRIKAITKGSIPTYLKPVLGDEQAVRQAIYNKAAPIDANGPLSNTLTKLATEFNVLQDGKLVDPSQEVRGATVIPETEPQPEQTNPLPPPRVLKQDDWSQQRKDLWDQAEAVRSSLPPNLQDFHQQISDIQSKIAKPGKGGLGVIRTDIGKLEDAVKGQAAVDQVKPQEAPVQPPKVNNAPPVDEAAQGAKKFDVPQEQPAAAPTPVEEPKAQPGTQQDEIAKSFGASDAAQKFVAEQPRTVGQPKEPKATGRASNEPGPQAQEPPPPKTLDPHIAATLKGAMAKLRGNISDLMSQTIPKQTPTETDAAHKLRNTAFQSTLDDLDNQQRAIGKAMASKNPQYELSKVGDDHFSSLPFDKFYDQADPKTQRLLDEHNKHVAAVLDAAREAAYKPDALGTNDLHASKIPTQMDRDLAYLIHRGSTARDMLHYVVTNGTTSVRRTVAARLIQLSKANPYPRMGTLAEAGHDHPGVAQVFGDYHPGYNRIRVFDVADLEHTLIHEFTHAATIQGIRSNPELAAQLQKLLDHAHTQITPTEARQYGFKNIKEMVAEAFANPKFAQFLDGLKPPKDLDYKLPGASIWRSFKELIRRTFGFPKGAETMLDHVMHLAGQTIDMTNAELSRKANSALGMDEEHGLYARGLIEEGERVQDVVRRMPREFGSRVFKATLGGRDLSGIADTMHAAMPETTDYTKNANDHRVLTDRLNALGKTVAAQRNKLDKATQKLISDLKTYTILDIDPRLDKFEKHTWLQNALNKADLEQQWRQANNKWNQLKRTSPEGAKVYLDETNVNRANLFAAHVGLVREVAGLMHSGELDLGADPFDAYKFMDKLHTDPQGAANFWQQTLNDHMGKIRKFLSEQRAAASAERDPVNSKAMIDKIQALSGVERHAARELTAVNRAPNFALRRQGKYMVSGTLAKLNQVANIARFQQLLQKAGFNDVVMQQHADNNTVYIRTKTLDQVDALHNVFLQAQKEGLLEPGKTINKGLAASIYERNGATPHWLSVVITAARQQMADNLEGMEGQEAEIYRTASEQAISNLVEQHLDLLPESSTSKIFTRREGVQGFNGDMNLAFDERAANTARAIANVAMRQRFSATMKGMRDRVDALKRDPNAGVGTAVRAQQVLHEVQLREAQRGWKLDKSAFDGVRHMTHMFELGFSVPYMVTLLSQVPTLGWSELAKQHGYAQSALAMARHTGMAFKIMKAAFSGDDKWHFTLTPDKLAKAGVPKNVADFILHQNNRGDFNLSSYTQWVYENQHGTIIPKIVHDVSGASTLYAEMAPRLITALAARDLYMQKPVTGKTFNDLHSFVSDKVNRSQFNWNPDLNPRYTGRHGVVGAASPLIAQFTGYHFKLLEKLYRETADAFGVRGEQYAKEGRRFMGMHLAAMAALSGTMGLPMVSWFAGLYDRLADLITGDHTHDIRASYRGFLNTTFGKDLGEVLAHGAPRAAGIDLTHLGEDRILLGTQLMTEKRQWEDAEKDWLKSMAGSAFGLGSDVVLAGRDFTNGDFLQAASRGMPEFFRNIADAALVSKYGFEDRSGFKMPITATTSDALMKLLGFDPARESEYREENTVKLGLKVRQEYDQQNIMRHLALAFNRQDPESYANWLQQSQNFMLSHPGLAPPAAGFGEYLRNHARSAALAAALGTPLGVSPRDLLARGMVSFGNLGNQ